MVPRLSYAIQNWCVSLLLFNRVHGNEYPYVYKSPVWGGSKSCVAVLYISYSVTSSSPCSKLCTLPRTIVINVAAAILVSNLVICGTVHLDEQCMFRNCKNTALGNKTQN